MSARTASAFPGRSRSKASPLTGRLRVDWNDELIDILKAAARRAASQAKPLPFERRSILE
jgi:hypothetical protein